MNANDKAHLVDGKYGICDLVDLAELRRIFERFTEATGFTIGFLDHPGLNILISTGWRDICTKFHRGCPVSADNCTKSNRHLLDELNEPGKLVVEQCENGLVDCVFPIIVKGEHIASLATGQLLIEKPDLERFKRQANLFGFDEHEYLRALGEVPVIPEEKLRSVTTFLGEMALVLSQLGYAHLTVKEESERLENEITIRKLAEAALRESEQRFRSYVERAPVAVLVTDRTGRIVDCNPAAVALLGYDEKILKGMVTQDLHPEEDHALVQEAQKALRGCGGFEGEFRMKRRNGQIIWVALTVGLIGADRTLGYCRDITEHKQAEERDRLAHDVLKRLNQPGGSTTDMIRDVLQMVQKSTGFEAAGIRMREGDDFPYYVHNGFSEDFLNAENTLVAGTPDGGICRNEDGSICLECTCGLVLSGKTDPANPLFTEGGSCWTNDSLSVVGFPASQDPRLHPRNRCIHDGFLSVALIPLRAGDEILGLLQLNDRRAGRFTLELIHFLEGLATSIAIALKREQAVEEKDKLQAQFMQAQKLESLGVLAGGIAHDFNNLLVGVLGNADLALLELPAESPARGNIQEVKKAAHRAADLCRQMLAYSGKGRFVVERLDLSALVREMAQMLEVGIARNVALRRTLAEDLPPIEGDATQIRQVVMNLITNASEATAGDDGVVSICTGVMDCDRAYLDTTTHLSKLPAGRYVFMEVSDTGCGMDKETQQRMFEPFFTTKFAGRGLGLAAALGIVRGHKGGIKVDSESGRGTTIKVLFPSAAGSASQAEDVHPVDREWKGIGTILVVDDEETVLTTASQILQKAGFAVITAHDGQQALDLFRQNPDRIACVLLDLTMPRMGGEAAFRELRRIQPDVRIVLSSGYNEQDAVQRFAGKGLTGFVQKPYQMAALLGCLQRVMQS